MGCSSSSTQTVAQEQRPGTKPEEANGDTGFVVSNDIVAEDTETIADQMQLPVQSGLSEELCPGLGDSETPAACDILHNVEVVPEQAIAEPTDESDLIQTTESPKTITPEEPPAPTEPPVLQEESSSAEVARISVQEVAAPVESVDTDFLPLCESPAEDQLVSTIPVEATSKASEAGEVLEAEQPAEESTVEHTVVLTPAVEPSTVPAPESKPGSEPSPVAELALATEPTPTGATPVPEPTSVVESTAAPEPTPAAEAAPAPEPIQVESTPDHEPTLKETPVAAEEPAPAPTVPEPIHVEATAAAAAAEVVLQAAQKRAAMAETSTDASTPDQPAMQALEASEGGVGEGAVSQAEIGEAKLEVALTEADLAAATKE